MAIKKYRLSKRNSDNTYDTVHIETSADMVKTADDKTVEASLSQVNSRITALEGRLMKSTTDIGAGADMADGVDFYFVYE